MRKAKEMANEIIAAHKNAVDKSDWKIFTNLLAEIWWELCSKEIIELRSNRKVSSDNGLIPIFKEQRQKYNAICKIVNGAISPNGDLLSITDFDLTIEEIMPDIKDWYWKNVLNINLN